MICRFAVRNFKGFRDWMDIDFSDIKNYEFNPETGMSIFGRRPPRARTRWYLYIIGFSV
jgi:hypothetical protein